MNNKRMKSKFSDELSTDPLPYLMLLFIPITMEYRPKAIQHHQSGTPNHFSSVIGEKQGWNTIQKVARCEVIRSLRHQRVFHSLSLDSPDE